jgi:hypothetical protein
MDLIKDEKKAFKLAIHCMKEVRQRRHAFNANLYTMAHVESQKRHYEKYQEINNAISILEKMME